MLMSINIIKYIGVVFDHKLRWDKWTETVNKKGQQRLYFLRKMMSFNVSISILRVFYNSFIESVFTFCITCWFGNATMKQKSSIRKVLSTASKIIGIPLRGLEQIYQNRCLSKATKITADSRHPLFVNFEK